MSTLDNLRREAKRWLEALRTQDRSARARLESAWPDAPPDPVLRDIQHALSREHGFESWKAFVHAIAERQASSAREDRAPGSTLERFASLAGDLLAARATGDPVAIDRLTEQFGGHATQEWIRAAVDHQLRTVPRSELPEGDFALPHARLVIARWAGFQNWPELERLLEPASRGSHRLPAAAPSHVPDIGPGMIQPVEMKAGFRMRLHSGVTVTTTQVWEMLVASRSGDLARVKDLVSAVPGLVVCDYNYMPPLHLAVREGHLDVVRYLAEQGAANPKHVTYPYKEPLTTIAEDRGYHEIAGILREHFLRADPNRSDDESGEIDYERDEERVLFQKLAGSGALQEVEAMLGSRPGLALDVFAFWSEGILSMPSNRGHRAMLELLIRYGASVPQVTKWGAWYYFKRRDIAAFLMERGMDAQHMNCHHTTLLHDMAYTGDVRKAALLLDHGAELDAIDEEFRSTPLGLAVRFGHFEMVEFLLDRRADPNAAGAPWATPLEWAGKTGRTDLEALLRRAGARAPSPQRGRATADETLLKALDEMNQAFNRRDARGLDALMQKHRAITEAHRPAWLLMGADAIMARADARRALPVRPDQAHLDREVETEGGGDAGRRTVARAYGAETWERLELAVRLIDAIWRDDVAVVREIVTRHPRLLHEDALIRPNSNWGPPMTYAANLGRNRIIKALHELGAKDLGWAFGRAVLQGQIDTARMLHEMGARPLHVGDMLEGPAETLNAQGMALLVELGVELNADTAPVGMVLQTYGRNPLGKHQILELFVRQGVKLPDTPPMAVHRGRIDQLDRHLRRDPSLFSRTFAHEEIFPLELGCDEDQSLALVGTPLGGSGLLHMCVEYDEMEIASWMIERGANVNLPARVDADGFGGNTPLFNCVVSLYGGRRRHGEFARLLLANGADPHVRASLRKGMRFSDDESVHEYHDVTPLEWGEQFHDRSLVNERALSVIREWE